MLSSHQIYERLNSLSRHQVEELISRLRSRGIRIRSIRPYAYPGMPQAFHIFFLYDGSDKKLEYFQPQLDMLQHFMQESEKTLRKHFLLL